MPSWECSCVGSGRMCGRPGSEQHTTNAGHGRARESLVRSITGAADAMVMFALMRFRIVAALLALLLVRPAAAAVERVRLVRSDADEITVQRANGDLWRLTLDRPCSQLASGWNHVLLIHYAVSFPGAGPQILVPDWDVACRATRADSVGHRPPAAQRETPEQGLGAMRETLEVMGYDCGGLSERGWTPGAAQAFTRYRESRRLDASARGLKRAVVALAI